MRRSPGASACRTCARNWKTLAFAELDTEARNSIVTRLARLQDVSGDRIGRIADAIKKKLAEAGIDAWVYGRAKRPYSIWRKLKDKQLNFEQLSDVLGFRVIVKTPEDCYRALGILHQNWRMIPDRFKDFISNPKTNGYRSIHTTVIGPELQRVEVQIRTAEMHDIAERGVAAHWRYREHLEGDPKDAALEWLRDMVDLLERGDSAEEFLEHSRLNMYQDQVFCFTPKGDLISPAARRHAPSISPMRCIPISATRRWAPRSMARMCRCIPAAQWRPGGNHPPERLHAVAFVGAVRGHGPRARRDQTLLKHAQRDEHVQFGRKILEKEFADHGQELTEKAIDAVAKKLRHAKGGRYLRRCRPRRFARRRSAPGRFPELKQDAKRKRGRPQRPGNAISIKG
jgi:guanosine-3',5'-bis(diphosphate) 3'-pyrophosphohydrolase